MWQTAKFNIFQKVLFRSLDSSTNLFKSQQGSTYEKTVPSFSKTRPVLEFQHIFREIRS